MFATVRSCYCYFVILSLMHTYIQRMHSIPPSPLIVILFSYLQLIVNYINMPLSLCSLALGILLQLQHEKLDRITVDRRNLTHSVTSIRAAVQGSNSTLNPWYNKSKGCRTDIVGDIILTIYYNEVTVSPSMVLHCYRITIHKYLYIFFTHCFIITHNTDGPMTVFVQLSLSFQVVPGGCTINSNNQLWQQIKGPPVCPWLSPSPDIS